MKGKVLIIAPHPDDETLGAGGTLLKMKDEGYSINWCIVTRVRNSLPAWGGGVLTAEKRDSEIECVAKLYGFDSVERLEIPATAVDEIPFGGLVAKFSDVIRKIEPDTLFLPYINDVHTDHYFTAKAVLSCCKWFRYPYIKNVLYYETISETDFNINTADAKINLNVFVDISKYYDKKIEALKVYSSELKDFPFPRSVKSIEALCSLRGSQCGVEKAESFELLRGVIS